MVLAQDWVTFTKSNPEAPIINLIQSDNQQMEFTVEVCGMFKNDTTVEGEAFQRIEIPRAGKSMETGEPELPYIRQLIAIPECENVILTVNITGQTDFYNYNIYPAPDYVEVQDTSGGVYLQEVFFKNETVYAQNTYLPGINAEIISTGYLRGQKYAEVFLWPVQFNPVTQHIDVYTNYEISLNFINPTTDVNVNTGIFNNVVSNTMLNYVSSGIRASINDNVQGNGNVQWISLTDTAYACTIESDYLIICSQDFFQPNNPDSEVLRIANHRATYNGFDVAILNADNIISNELSFFYEGLLIGDETYKNEQRIRTCISRIYEGANAQHTYDGKLGYVLLAGDVYEDSTGVPISRDTSNNVIVPWGEGDWYPNDYYYSCVTNIAGEYDDVGDLYIGRFSVGDEIELHNMVEKNIFFESEYIFEDWRNNIVFSNGRYDDNLFEDDFPLYYGFIDEIIADPFQLSIYNAYEMSPFAVRNQVKESINGGSLIQVYNGHGGKMGWYISWGVVLNNEYFLNTVSNNSKYPFALSFACNTGWLDYTEDCMAEFTTSYSENNGFVGFLGSPRNMLGFCNINLNTFNTVVPNSIFTHLSHIAGESILEARVLTFVVQERFGYNYFGDPALNIMALGFEVTQNTTLSENTIISNEIIVRPGAVIIIPPGGFLYFDNNGKLIIEEGASLSICNGSKVQGKSNNNKIIVQGNIYLGNNIEFSAQPGQEWGGICLDNSANNYSFNNVTFENCLLSGKSNKLTINTCSFTNSGIKYQKGDLVIESSNFDNSKVDAVLGNSLTNYVEIKSNCTFQNCEVEPAIHIDGYYNYSIDGCTITGNYGDGIGIYNSGSATSTNDIKNNTITYNGWENSGSGIVIYHSYANIRDNIQIEKNEFGIKCLDRSEIFVGGEKENISQVIKDNDSYEILATGYSFPYYFRWNLVQDDDNEPGDPLIKYTGPDQQQLNVTYNCWGYDFIASEDLDPVELFIWDPVWNCFNGGGSGGGSEAETMYLSAQNKIAAEDYTGAKIDFHQIVDLYPSSEFAHAALKEIFSIEEFDNNDYSGLKTYYNSEPNIVNNLELTKLADFLANFCEIKLENWPTAIAWFENVIQNPESLEDSIFAIIDLGYTYFLMENGGLKSAYTGNLTDHIPVSRKQFEEKRDYLLSLIPGDRLSETMKESISLLKPGELLQNVPNPFSNKTDIYYKLDKEAITTITIFDNTGKLIRTISEGMAIQGINKLVFDGSGLPSGIYFYNLKVNGQVTDSKKLVIKK